MYISYFGSNNFDLTQNLYYIFYKIEGWIKTPEEVIYKLSEWFDFWRNGATDTSG